MPTVKFEMFLNVQFFSCMILNKKKLLAVIAVRVITSPHKLKLGYCIDNSTH